MDERELAAGLPAPRDDDPPALRQDILDELDDHFHCAIRRELLNGADLPTARERAIERFGDPADVARRLWLQATWSKIMTQRLTIGAIAILGILSVTLAFAMGWSFHRQAMAAQEQQRTMAEMLARVAQLAESTDRAAATASNTATIVSSIQLKLTLDTPDGPPAVGFHATLGQLGFDRSRTISELTDSDGSVEFGYCDPGRYEITIETPWGFRSDPRRFLLRPATAQVESIVYPPQPGDAEVTFVADLPDDLVQAGVSAIVSIPDGTLSFGDSNWKENGRRNRVVEIGRDPWKFHQVRETGFVQVVPNTKPKWRTTLKPEEKPSSVKIGVRYPVRGVRLVSPTSVQNNPQIPARIAEMYAQRRGLFDQVAPQPPERSQQLPQRPQSDPSLVFPLDFELVAEPGKLNRWEIPIPDELIEQARSYLKATAEAEESEK